jgi:ER membrane protein complex subunit 7
MMFYIILVLFLSTNIIHVHGERIEGTVPYGSGLKVILNGGERITYVKTDSSFLFESLPPGKYLLEIQPGQAVYSTWKFEISEDDQVVSIEEFKYPGAPGLTGSLPLQVNPVAPAIYYEERPRFSLWRMLANPTGIMMLMMAAMVIGVPYLEKMKEDMDPESLAELETQQKQISAVQRGDFGSLLGQLMGTDDSSSNKPSQSDNSKTSSSSTNSNSNAKKRSKFDN